MPDPARELNDDKACVTTEFRGDVCVVRCLDQDGRDLVADLRAGLRRCRESGAEAIVFDLDGSVEVGPEAVEVLSAAAEELRVAGGSLVVATEAPAVRATLAEFLANGPNADELAKAKQNIVGGFALRIDSNRKIVENLAAIGFYDLPLNYLDEFAANVEKVGIDDVRRAFAKHVDPARMVTVVVGADEKSLAAGAK